MNSKDPRQAPLPTKSEEICPCCEGVLSLTPEQRAGREPVDCPNPGCGFNQVFDFTERK